MKIEKIDATYQAVCHRVRPAFFKPSASQTLTGGPVKTRIPTCSFRGGAWELHF